MPGIMKPILELVTVLAVSVVLQAGVKERYGFKQARVVVEKSTKNSSVETTTRDTVFLDEHGWVEVRYSHTVEDIRMIKQRRESRSVSIMEHEWLTSYDPETRKGQKLKNPFYHTVGNLSTQQQKGMGEGMLKAFEAKTTSKGTEVIAGKTCDVTETSTGLKGMETVTTTWMWKGLLMKSVSSGMGTEITELVTSIDETVGVSPAHRKIPADVEIRSSSK